MKKLVIIFLVISITPIYSQFLKSYGFKVGGTISHQDWNPALMPGDALKEDRLGVNIGAFTEFINMPVLSIVTEINYIQKGFKSTYLKYDDGYTSFASWNMRIDYINISLLAKSKLDFGIVKPYLFLGPRIDHEVKKTSSISNNVYYDFKKNLVGLKVGIGTELEIFQIRLLGEFSYDYGFGDLNKRENVEVKSNSIDFRLGMFL